MAGRTLCAEDVWPLVQKMPRTERLKLSNCLKSLDCDWNTEELADVSDWGRLASPGDEDLLDPRGGTRFSWKPSR